MKKRSIVFAVIAAICMASWLLFQPVDTDSADESQIVAEFSWNGTQHQISLADLNAAIAELPVYRQENYNKKKEKKVEYLEEYVTEELKRLAAKDMGFDKDKELLEKAENYRHQLMVEKLTEVEVDQKIAYTDEDLERYYEAHKGEYTEKATVRATCIGVKEEEVAQDILNRVKAGEDMLELAKELAEKGQLVGPGSNRSNPGDTFTFTQDASKRWQPFINAVFEMEVGDMTQELFSVNVDNEMYYLVFRKEEHNPDRQKAFGEVKDKVERAVERESKKQRISDWVVEVTTQGKLKTFAERIPEPEPKSEDDESEPDDEE